MKVAIYEPFGSGGICHYTYQLSQSLVHKGIDITVLTQERYELKDLNIDFKVIGQLGKSRLKLYLKNRLFQKNRTILLDDKRREKNDVSGEINENNRSVENIIRRWIIWMEVIEYLVATKTKILHIQWLLYPGEDYYYLKLLRFFNKKLIYTAHNVLPHDNHSIKEIEIFKKIYNTVDEIIVHTEINKNEIIDLFELDPKKVSVIPHGIYDMFFANGVISQNEARREIKIPETKKVILFFGTVRKYKGLEYLIDAFTEVKKKMDDAFLLVVGKAGGSDEEKKNYSRLIASLHNYQDIKCVDEYVPLYKVDSFFSASDVVVLPYVKTYQSGILLLSFAAGKPVIVTETGGLSETVEEGKSGFIVPTENAEMLAFAIVSMLSDTSRMKAMGQYGKNLANTIYSWDNVATKTIEVYHKI